MKLGDRMKYYEMASKSHLTRRTPVIVRLDGKAFHTWTKNCDRPYDWDLDTIRKHSLKELCENIQGVVLGYAQSDEFSIILKDWNTFNTDPWFGNNVQKIVSVSSSILTAEFNFQVMCLETSKYQLDPETYSTKFKDLAYFDSRAFNVPKEEVLNYFIWRQQDAERNSVLMSAQSLYSHKELQGKSCKQLISQMEDEKGVIWGDLPVEQKRGIYWTAETGVSPSPRFQERDDPEIIRIHDEIMSGQV